MDIKNENWDLEIKSKASLLDLRLADVWNYRDLLCLFVKRDFVAAYKQTILRPIWNFIQPLLTPIMYVIVWRNIAHIPTDGIPPILFYLAGVTLWNYFSNCLSSTSTTFTSNASIFGKVYFPRLVLPLSVVISNMVKFGIQFLMLIIAMIWYNFNEFPINLSINLIFLPFLLILMAGIGLGLGIIISSLTTKYRDFVVLLGFIMQLLMYATPIIYPLSYIQPGVTRRIMEFNPITPIAEAFKYILFNHKGTVEITSMIYSILFMIIALFIGAIMFNKVEKSFMDTV